MGSGCNTNCTGLFQKLIPDTGVKYTGSSIPALGICTGDLLSEVDAIILQKILDYATGVGISISSVDLSTCQAFTSCITNCNACTDLPCLLTCFKNAICEIFTSEQTLATQVTALLSGPYDQGCLSLPPGSELPAIIQEIILEFCNLVASVNALNTSVSGFTSGINTTIGNALANMLQSCGSAGLVKTGSGSSFVATFNGFVPIGGIIPYGGPTIGLFDGSGLGVSNMCGWAIANGNHGTVNMMGQTPVGLTNMGGSLPANAVGLSLTTSGQMLGEVAHVLISDEIPPTAVTGTITDPGHNHAMYIDRYGFASPGGGSTQGWALLNGDQMCTIGGGIPNTPTSGFGGLAPTGSIVNSKTGITLDSASTGGGGGAHNNMQPSIGLLYIQRIS